MISSLHGYINMGWKITDFDTYGVGIDAWPMSTSQWLHSLQRFAKQLRCLCDVSPTPSQQVSQVPGPGTLGLSPSAHSPGVKSSKGGKHRMQISRWPVSNNLQKFANFYQQWWLEPDISPFVKLCTNSTSFFTEINILDYDTNNL